MAIDPLTYPTVHTAATTLHTHINRSHDSIPSFSLPSPYLQSRPQGSHSTPQGSLQSDFLQTDIIQIHTASCDPSAHMHTFTHTLRQTQNKHTNSVNETTSSLGTTSRRIVWHSFIFFIPHLLLLLQSNRWSLGKMPSLFIHSFCPKGDVAVH